MPKHLNLPPAGPLFYAHVFHPAYNLDPEELAETANRFANHTRAVGKGVQGLRNIFSQIRQARVGAWPVSSPNPRNGRGTHQLTPQQKCQERRDCSPTRFSP